MFDLFADDGSEAIVLGAPLTKIGKSDGNGALAKAGRRAAGSDKRRRCLCQFGASPSMRVRGTVGNEA